MNTVSQVAWVYKDIEEVGAVFGQCFLQAALTRGNIDIKHVTSTTWRMKFASY